MPVARNNKYVVVNDMGEAEAGEGCGRARKEIWSWKVPTICAFWRLIFCYDYLFMAPVLEGRAPRKIVISGIPIYYSG